MTRAIKQAATIVDHVARLRDRGMEVDATLAKQWLTYVSYYRLSAYWYPARVMDAQGRRTDRLKPGISFSDAVALYEADRKLRALV
ncbi:Abi family protein, partial [Gleimia europaea]|nr:Abi family protein [Gleimia europaea]